MATFTNVFFIVIIVLGGLLCIVFNEVADYIVTFCNRFIGAGEVSVDYVDYFGFVIGLLRAASFLIIFAASAWAIVRAIERRNAGV